MFPPNSLFIEIGIKNMSTVRFYVQIIRYAFQLNHFFLMRDSWVPGGGLRIQSLHTKCQKCHVLNTHVISVGRGAAATAPPVRATLLPCMLN